MKEEIQLAAERFDEWMIRNPASTAINQRLYLRELFFTGIEHGLGLAIKRLGGEVAVKDDTAEKPKEVDDGNRF